MLRTDSKLLPPMSIFVHSHLGHIAMEGGRWSFCTPEYQARATDMKADQQRHAGGDDGRRLFPGALHHEARARRPSHKEINGIRDILGQSLPPYGSPFHCFLCSRR